MPFCCTVSTPELSRALRHTGGGRRGGREWDCLFGWERRACDGRGGVGGCGPDVACHEASCVMPRRIISPFCVYAARVSSCCSSCSSCSSCSAAASSASGVALSSSFHLTFHLTSCPTQIKYYRRVAHTGGGRFIPELAVGAVARDSCDQRPGWGGGSVVPGVHPGWCERPA
jgi:hypothetical protein